MGKTQIERLKKKQAQIAARLQDLEAAEKTKERKKDLRRKILLGALVLEKLKEGDESAKSLKSKLSDYLTRDNDRALFELSALPKQKSESKA